MRVPHPFAMKENILVMELIGQEDAAAPPLKDVELDAVEAERIYQKIIEYISLLYNQAGLVHADLSEFNILYDRGEPVIIDMGQSVTLDHPQSRRFLERDISNIANYFRKKYSIGSSEEIWDRIQKDRELKNQDFKIDYKKQQ